jgi:hypothetical protein
LEHSLQREEAIGGLNPKMKMPFLISLLGFTLAAVPSARATVLAPGGSCIGCATPVGLDQTVLIKDSGLQTMTSTSVTGNNLFNASFRSIIYQHATGGTLDFYYQFTVNSSINGSNGIVDFMAATDFTGFATDVGTTAFNLPGFPSSGAKSAPFGATQPTAGLVDFIFNSLFGGAPVSPGMTTVTMVVATNATNWKAGDALLQDGSQADFAAFSPTAAVPEPASIILFGSVLGLSSLIARRKKSRKR